jgi:choline dehydrogenase-like flavoprotein
MRDEYDAIVVGSGPAGATVARELSKRRKRVLILERGGNAPVKQGLLGTAAVLSTVSVGDKLSITRAFTTGGTSSLYFAVANDPSLEIFRSLGVDLSGPLAEAKKELPIAPLPDELLGAQAIRVRDSARSLGLSWDKNPMLIDQTRCSSGFAATARWNARSYVSEAVEHGAALVNRAQVVKVLADGNRAIGVEYKLYKGKKEFEVRKAFGAKVILAAGGAATPRLLRESGMPNVGNDGFYIHPCFAMFGMVPGLKAGENFVGSMETELDGDINIGDANFDRTFYRMFMLDGRRLVRAFLHSRSIGVGVALNESLGGEMREDGRYHKTLTHEDLQKLEKGAEVARRILVNAGGKNLFRSTVGGAHLGGSIRIRKHVDESLQTEWSNLHVCDGSVIPETVKSAPTLTLICLGKYLADRLAPAL